MGALELIIAQLPINNNTFAIQLDSLVNMAQRLLTDKEAFETNLMMMMMMMKRRFNKY